MKNPINLNEQNISIVESLEKEMRKRHTFTQSDIELFEQAKVIENEQKGYSEENVREMLFMALYESQEECCTTHTKDSIVRKVLKTFNQLRLAEQLENEIDNL